MCAGFDFDGWVGGICMTKKQNAEAHEPMDRRSFFRGAASLRRWTGRRVGWAPARCWRLCSRMSRLVRTLRRLLRPLPRLNSTHRLGRALRWAGQAPADWVKPHPGADHNVVIVGGGQSGIGLAYGLQRKVGRVDVIEQSQPGQAGIWRNIARMHQLRTPKTMVGPEQGNSALGVRAWYETLHGEAAFDRLDRIPRLEWAEYLGVVSSKSPARRLRYRTPARRDRAGRRSAPAASRVRWSAAHGNDAQGDPGE